MSEPTIKDCEQALNNVRAVLSPTPLTRSLSYSEYLGHPVYLKWENKHRTGSFKERGVVNMLANMSQQSKKSGVCTASAGNHALALSYHAKRCGIKCHIVMP